MKRKEMKGYQAILQALKAPPPWKIILKTVQGSNCSVNVFTEVAKDTPTRWWSWRTCGWSFPRWRWRVNVRWASRGNLVARRRLRHRVDRYRSAKTGPPVPPAEPIYTSNIYNSTRSVPPFLQGSWSWPTHRYQDGSWKRGNGECRIKMQGWKIQESSRTGTHHCFIK